ncbi:hypothetical protein JCM10450v2_001464 [Rhodotorula kratochvilovae]
MPLFNSSNPWRSHSQPPPPSRSRPAAPPRRRPSASQPATPPERTPSPPEDDRTRALGVLALLDARFRSLARDFAPPAPGDLVFTPKASAAAPKLAFTPVNAPVHGYEEALTRLLTELDAVESGGDDEVRRRRKGLVQAVEGEAQRVERWRRECWEARERGADGPAWVKTVFADGDSNGEARQAGVGSAENGQSGPSSRRPLPGQFSARAHTASPASRASSSSTSTAHAPRPAPPLFFPGEGAKLHGTAPEFRPSPAQPQTRPHSGGQPYRPSPASAHFSTRDGRDGRDERGGHRGERPAWVGVSRDERARAGREEDEGRGPRWASGGGVGEGGNGGAWGQDRGEWNGGRDGRRTGGGGGGAGGWW